MTEEHDTPAHFVMQSYSPVDGEKDFQRQQFVEQAIAEGHDTDIPSDIGYIPDERSEANHRHSTVNSRQNPLTQKSERPSHDIEKGIGDHEKKIDIETSGTLNDDANVVWWDGPDDPTNPYNWPSWKKVVNCGLISTLTFITPLASSIFAPGVPELMEEFRSRSTELAAFVVSVYVLGFASGPLVMAPMSEIYGRAIVYHTCNFGYIAFVIGCALAPSLNALIVFRFLSGIFGSCPLTNGGGSIADMFTQENRAVAMVRIFSLLTYSVNPNQRRKVFIPVLLKKISLILHIPGCV